LYDDFESEYSRYFADKAFDDALQVGDKRIMVTLKLQGPFNNPEYYTNPLLAVAGTPAWKGFYSF